MRIHSTRREMGYLGVGVSLGAILFLYPDATSLTPLLDRVVAFAVAMGAALLIYKGLFFTTPAAETDEKWDERFDKLRNEAANFTRSVDGFPLQTPDVGAGTFSNWREVARMVPIPAPDLRPLQAWGSFLEGHSDPMVRSIFAFAKVIEQGPVHSAFRRLAVRTYHRFGRLLRAEAAEFEDWMETEGLADGSEELVVLLAYMEVARACEVKVGRAGNRYAGFWYLAHSWHPHVVELPQ